MTTTRNHRARQLSAAEVDQRRADMAALTYTDDCECRVCGAHFADAHARSCPRGDGFNDMSDDEARKFAEGRADSLGVPVAADYLASIAYLGAFHLATVNDDVTTGEVVHAWCASRVLVRGAGTDAPAVFSMVTGEVIDVPADLFDADQLPAEVAEVAEPGAFRFTSHKRPDGYGCRWSRVSVVAPELRAEPGNRSCPDRCPGSDVEADPTA